MALYVKNETPGAALASPIFYSEPPSVALASTAQEDFIAQTEADRKDMNRMLLIGAGLFAVGIFAYLTLWKTVIKTAGDVIKG